MILRFLMAAGMAIWLMSSPVGTQGFSGDNPQNATQAAPNVGSDMGDATRALLKVQHDRAYTGEFVPLHGEQTALTYQHYLDLFSRPMPGLSQTAPSAKSAGSNQATTAC